MCRKSNSGRRVFTLGLQNNRWRIDAKLAQLLSNHEPVLFIADNDRRRVLKTAEPRQRLLQHRVTTH